MLINRNSGTANTVAGMKVEARTIPNRTLRPLNRYIAKAYPASVAMIDDPKEAMTAYTAVFRIHNAKCP